MANIAEQLRAMTASVAGVDYGGRIEEFHPARLMIMTHDYHAGAMDAPVQLDMGMETPEARLIINGYHGNIINQFGLANANAVEIQVQGGLEDYNGDVRNITWDMTGNVTDMPFGRIRGRGEVPKTILQMACSFYQITIDGTVHAKIDILNMIREIGGVDRMAALRAAIGL